MNVRSIGASIVGIGMLAGFLSACGDDDTSGSARDTSSTRVSSPSRPDATSSAAPASSSPTTGSDEVADLPAAPAPAPVDVDQPTTPAPPRPTTTTPADDGPHDLLGNIAIWTSTDGNPLNGAAFDVRSCGEADDVGAVDMAEQSMIDVPVSVDCWTVSLTRTPGGYRLDGPPERTVHLDAQTNEVNMSFRFLPL